MQKYLFDLIFVRNANYFCATKHKYLLHTFFLQFAILMEREKSIVCTSHGNSIELGNKQLLHSTNLAHFTYIKKFRRVVEEKKKREEI